MKQIALSLLKLSCIAAMLCLAGTSHAQQRTGTLFAKKELLKQADYEFFPQAQNNPSVFIPRGLHAFDTEFEFTVTDQHGKQLYHTTEATPWNGRPNNEGELCGKGRYAYAVVFLNEYDLEESVKGIVTLR